jgi:hypothetical protein
MFDECKHLFVYYDGAMTNAFEELNTNIINADPRMYIFQRICKEKPSFYKDFILPLARKYVRGENEAELAKLNEEIKKHQDEKEKKINEIRSNKRKKSATKKQEIENLNRWAGSHWMIAKKRKFEEALNKQD